jgi:hypothetical protein
MAAPSPIVWTIGGTGSDAFEIFREKERNCVARCWFLIAAFHRTMERAQDNPERATSSGTGRLAGNHPSLVRISFMPHYGTFITAVAD